MTLSSKSRRWETQVTEVGAVPLSQSLSVRLTARRSRLTKFEVERLSVPTRGVEHHDLFFSLLLRFEELHIDPKIVLIQEQVEFRYGRKRNHLMRVVGRLKGHKLEKSGGIIDLETSKAAELWARQYMQASAANFYREDEFLTWWQLPPEGTSTIGGTGHC
jgi:hypothetical protein